MDSLAVLRQATTELCAELEPLVFSAPVTHVYNPLLYARAPHDLYLQRFATSRKRVLYLGMNPGPSCSSLESIHSLCPKAGDQSC